MTIRRLRLLAALAVLAACSGGDSVVGPSGPGTASQLTLTTAPASTAQSGVALSPQPQVRLRDATGRPVPLAGVQISASTAGGVTLGNATAVTDGSGIATFSGLTLTGIVGQYTLHFSSGTLSPVDAPATTLGAGAPAVLAVSTAPSVSAQAGAALAIQPVIQLRDASGNNASTQGVTVTASLVSGTPTLTNATATSDANGRATFAGLAMSGAVGNYTLRFSATGLSSVDAVAGTSLAAGPPTQIALATAPSSTATNGAVLPTQAVIQLRDAFGNDAQQANTIVVASIVSAPTGGGTLAGDSATTGGNGRATFSGMKITGVAGTYGVRFSTSGLSSINANVVLTSGAAARIGVVTQPAPGAVNGAALSTQPSIQVQDQSGNAVVQAGVVIHVTATPAGAVLANDSATTDVLGKATFVGLSLTGTAAPTAYTLQFSAPGLTGASANGPTVLSSGSATKLVLATQPSVNATNDVKLSNQPVVRLQDVSGNNAGQAGVTVTASLVSGSLVLDSATATTTAGGVATFSGLKLTGAVGSYTLRFSASGLTSIDAAAATTLNPGALAQLSLTTQPSVAASSGVALAVQPVVQLRDVSGNAVATAGVQVTASIVGGGATLGGATATTVAGGAATFSTLAVTGPLGGYALRFSVGGVSVDAAQPVTVNAGSASQLTLEVEPATTAGSGAALATQPVVQLRDPSGNPVSQAGVVVTATVVSGTISFAGGTATTNASGVATFAGLAMSGVVGNYTLSFTSGVLSAATAAAPTALTAGAATQLTLTQEASVTASGGVVLATQPVVQLRDGAGNVVSQSGVVVTATVVSGTITFAGGTATTDGSGVATFAGLSMSGLVGNYTLRFTSGGLSSATAAAPTALAAGAATQMTLTQQASVTASSGAVLATQPVVQLRDASGNVVSQPGVVVTATVVTGTITFASGTATTNASGVATFAGLAMSGVVGSYTLRFTSGVLSPATAAAPTALAAGTATQLTLTQEASVTASSGVALATQPIVQLRDASGNAVSQSGVVVTTTVVSGTITFAGGAATTNASGVATFATLAMSGATGSYTLRFTSGILGAATAAAPTALTAGAATQLSLTTQPPVTASSGVALTTQPVVQLRDGSGNAVSQAGVVVTATVVSGTITFAGGTATTDGSGVATFAGLAMSGVAGNYTLRFTSGGLSSATAAAPTALAAGAATQLTLTTQPSVAASSGVALATQPVVQLRDASGNAVSQPGVVVTATVVSGTITFASGTATTNASGVATFAGLAMSGVVGSYTLRFTSGVLSAATAAAPTVLAAGAATQLTLTQEASVTASSGVALATQPVVQLRDGSGNAVSQSGVVVTATVVSGTITFAGGTATTNASGVATFTTLAMSGAVGNYTLRFTSGILGAATAAAPTALAAGVATQLSLTTQPSVTASSGAALTTQPVVQLRDASGNPVNQAGVVVTATVVSGTITFAGGTATTDVLGEASFTGLAMSGVVGNYTLRFTSGGLSSATASAPTALAAGVATQMSLTTQPSVAASNGVALTTQPVVQLRDASGNAVSQAGVVVTATVVSGTITFASGTATTSASGVATFAGLAMSGVVGSYTVRFTSGGLSSATAAAPTALAAGAATQLTLTQEASVTASSGVALATQPIVQLRDASNNPVSQAGVVVTATVVSGTITFASGTATTNASGVATFAGLAMSGVVGSYTLRFTSGILGAATAAAPTALTAGAATQLTLTQEASVTASSGAVLATQPVVQLRDASGNPVSQAGVVVTATVVSGTITFAGATATTNASGVATFTTLTMSGSVGSYTLRFTSGGLSAATAAAPTALAAGVATQLALTTQPSVAASNGVALTTQPVVQLRDGAGNAVSQAGVVVTATVVSGTITFAGGTATTDGSGVATFAGLAMSGVVGNYSLRFTAGGLSSATAAAQTALAAGAATQLTLTQEASVTASSGVALATQPIVQLRDASNNPVSQAGVVVTATVVSGTITFASGTATTNASGVATFAGLSMSGVVGSYTLRFTSGGLTAATAAAPTALAAGAATQLTLTQEASVTASSGVALATQPIVQLRDASNNPVSQAGVVVTATVVSGTITFAGGTATTNASGVATFTTLTMSGLVGNYTLRFTSGGLSAATAAAQTALSAGPAVALAIQQQPSTAATNGAALVQQPIVLVVDNAGNTVPGSSAPVTATVVAGSAAFANGVVSAVSGVATFGSLSMTGPAGSYTLRFTSPGLTAVNASAATSLAVGPATQLVLVTQPSTTGSSGVVLASQPVVQLRDVGDNDVSQAGVSVAATVISGSVTFANGSAITTAAGTATFSGLALSGTAGSYTLRFTSGILAAADAAAPTVLGPGLPATISIITAPPLTAVNGAALSVAPVVEVQDDGGNLVPGVVIDAGAAGATVSGNTATTLGNGRATFGSLVLTGVAAGYSIRFCYPLCNSSSVVVGSPTPTNLTAGAPANAALQTVPSSIGQSGVVLGTQPVVTVTDVSGNPVDGVTVTAAAAGGTVASNSAVTDLSGNAAFSLMSVAGSPGSYTLSFTSGAANVTAPLSLGVGPAASLVINTAPAGATNGLVFTTQPVVTVRDATGNPIPGATVVVTTDGTVVVNNGTALTNLSGVATFTGLGLTGAAGAHTLDFTSDAATASAGVSMVAGSATTFSITTQPATSAVNGAALSPQPIVHITDGTNPVQGVIVTASVVSGPTLANFTATTDGSGNATFSGLSMTGVIGSYKLHFNAQGSVALEDSATTATTLTASVAVALAIQTQPSTTAASDAALAQQPTVQLVDVGGNAKAQSGVVVTASIVGGSGTVLNATATTSAGGLATFSGLAIRALIGGRTLRFSASGLASATAAAPTVITPGAANKLTVTTQPSNSSVLNQPLQVQPVIQIRDLAGNAVSQSGTTITASVVSGGAPTLSGTTATTNGTGEATFSALTIVSPSGQYRFRFSATGLTAVNAQDSTVASTLLTSGVPVTGLSGVATSAQTYAITVLPGDTSLVVTITSSSGVQGEDADLYVRAAQVSNIHDGVQDCFPNLPGSEETCQMHNPTPGLWYVTVYGFFSYSQVTLTATRLFP